MRRPGAKVRMDVHRITKNPLVRGRDGSHAQIIRPGQLCNLCNRNAVGSAQYRVRTAGPWNPRRVKPAVYIRPFPRHRKPDTRKRGPTEPLPDAELHSVLYAAATAARHALQLECSMRFPHNRGCLDFQSSWPTSSWRGFGRRRHCMQGGRCGGHRRTKCSGSTNC
jgi:hypothetical protein